MVAEQSISTIKNISPAAAQEVLKANGLTVSAEEAAAVVDFLYILASSSISASE